MDRFDACLAVVLRFEGGYSDDPSDPGGATNHGVTQRAYDAFRDALHDPRRAVIAIEDGEVKAIYRADYWLRTHCDVAAAPLDLALFDSAVNSGPTQAARWLQHALGVTADGRIGPQTLTALRLCDPREVAVLVIDQREAFDRDLAKHRPTLAKFLRGWLHRLDGLRVACDLPHVGVIP